MTTITKPDSDGQQKSFSFDHSYWSFDKSDPNYAGQQRIYEDLGVELLDHSFGGYNTCIVACKSLCAMTFRDALIQRLARRKGKKKNKKKNTEMETKHGEQLTIAAALLSLFLEIAEYGKKERRDKRYTPWHLIHSHLYLFLALIDGQTGSGKSYSMVSVHHLFSLFHPFFLFGLLSHRHGHAHLRTNQRASLPTNQTNQTTTQPSNQATKREKKGAFSKDALAPTAKGKATRT